MLLKIVVFLSLVVIFGKTVKIKCMEEKAYFCTEKLQFYFRFNWR